MFVQVLIQSTNIKGHKHMQSIFIQNLRKKLALQVIVSIQRALILGTELLQELRTLANLNYSSKLHYMTNEDLSHTGERRKKCIS